MKWFRAMRRAINRDLGTLVAGHDKDRVSAEERALWEEARGPVIRRYAFESAMLGSALSALQMTIGMLTHRGHSTHLAFGVILALLYTATVFFSAYLPRLITDGRDFVSARRLGEAMHADERRDSQRLPDEERS